MKTKIIKAITLTASMPVVITTVGFSNASSSINSNNNLLEGPKDLTTFGVVNNENVGSFDSIPTSNQIINALVNNHPSLVHPNDIEIVGTISANGTQIRGKVNSVYYTQAIVTIKFTISPLPDNRTDLMKFVNTKMIDPTKPINVSPDGVTTKEQMLWKINEQLNFPSLNQLNIDWEVGDQSAKLTPSANSTVYLPNTWVDIPTLPELENLVPVMTAKDEPDGYTVLWSGEIWGQTKCKPNREAFRAFDRDNIGNNIGDQGNYETIGLGQYLNINGSSWIARSIQSEAMIGITLSQAKTLNFYKWFKPPYTKISQNKTWLPVAWKLYGSNDNFESKILLQTMNFEENQQKEFQTFWNSNANEGSFCDVSDNKTAYKSYAFYISAINSDWNQPDPCLFGDIYLYGY